MLPKREAKLLPRAQRGPEPEPELAQEPAQEPGPKSGPGPGPGPGPGLEPEPEPEPEPERTAFPSDQPAAPAHTCTNNLSQAAIPRGG